MKITIVGAGVVGTNLALQLSREGHDICVIEKNPGVIRRHSDRVDALFVAGSGTSGKAMAEARIEGSDLAVAVTDSDEVNLIACLLSLEYGVKRRIARIRNPEYTDSGSKLPLKTLGVDLAVNPRHIIVESILKMIDTPGATDAAEFADGKILLRGFRVPRDAPIAWKKLSELREASELDSFLIAAISRRDRLIIPNGADEIQPNDTVFVIVAEETLPLFLPFVNRRVDPVEKIVIYGGSPSGLQLARALSERDLSDLVLIEPDEELAQKAASELSGVIVLHGEGTDPDILQEAGVKGAQFFIALTRDDESNMLASLLAKEKGAKRTIAVTQNPDYIDILESIGIDIVLNPRIITASKILQFIRAGKIMSVVKLHESDAEVIEMEALPKSRAVGKALKDVRFPQGAIIGAILHDNMMQIPDGNTIINGGDRVVVFARPEAIHDVEKLFTRRRFL